MTTRKKQTNERTNKWKPVTIICRKKFNTIQTYTHSLRCHKKIDIKKHILQYNNF